LAPVAELYNKEMAGSRRSLSMMEGSFAICRLDKNAPIPDWAFAGEFISVARTPDELSIVCPQTSVPEGTDCETGWRCLKVESPFEFDLTGMISSVATSLVEEGLVLFVVATQDSDYLLVKETDLEQAVLVLARVGHRVERQSR
jgi:uncharacterized protein